MSGRILSIDTTSEFGSIALIEDGGVAEEILLHSPDGFGHVLFDQIARLLNRSGVAVSAINCFAAASGPGSFTGVRVGLTAAKGLAEATGRPVAAVSNLRALAWFGQGALRATLLDARRGEVYTGLYDAGLSGVVPEAVTKFAPWAAALPADAEVIALDTTPFAPLLPGRIVIQAPRALAGAVGLIAWRDWMAGRGQDPVAVDANYVRRSDAELLWKDEL